MDLLLFVVVLDRGCGAVGHDVVVSLMIEISSVRLWWGGYEVVLYIVAQLMTICNPALDFKSI